MNDLPWSPSKRAEVWRSMFNIEDPAKRIANIYEISCQFRNLSPPSREKSKSTTGAKRWRTDVHCKELIHAVGDRSTALKVSRVADLPKSMIDRSVAHVQTLKLKQLDAKKVPADKRGTRAASPERLSKSQGFSPTHLLFLVCVTDKTKRRSIFYDSLKNNWSLAEMKAAVKATSLNKAPVRPLNLTYATRIHASKLTELLKRIMSVKLATKVDVVRPSERKRAADECKAAVKQLKAIQAIAQSAIDELESASTKLK